MTKTTKMMISKKDFIWINHLKWFLPLDGNEDNEDWEEQDDMYGI